MGGGGKGSVKAGLSGHSSWVLQSWPHTDINDRNKSYDLWNISGIQALARTLYPEFLLLVTCPGSQEHTQDLSWSASLEPP